MLKTLDSTIRIGSTPTFLYFDLYLYSADAANYVYYDKSGFVSQRSFQKNKKTNRLVHSDINIIQAINRLQNITIQKATPFLIH